MIEKHYILLFDNDLITSSILTLSIQVLDTHSHVYQVAETEKAFLLIEKVVLSSMDDQNHQKEICIIVDLNLKRNKGYFFLETLFKRMLPYSIKVYTVKNEHQEFTKLQHLPKVLISGELEKPLGMDEVEEFLFPRKRVVCQQEAG